MGWKISGELLALKGKRVSCLVVSRMNRNGMVSVFEIDLSCAIIWFEYFNRVIKRLKFERT